MDANLEAYGLDGLSAQQFAQVAAANPVILLPLGSHEDHGPHLPMGDYRLAEQLAGRIAQAATQAGTPCFVAPCLPFGVADYFGCSPGGLAVSAASFRAVLEDLLGGLLRHGLTRIIILNGHGGNVPVIHEVTLALKRRDGLLIPSFYLWKIARQLMERQLGPGAGARFGHGAEPLLSLTMALRPGSVQASAAPSTPERELLGLPVSGFGTLDFEGVGIEAPAEFDRVPRDATAAAWPLASAELGAGVADALVGVAANFVVHFANVASAAGVSKSSSTASVST
jgi:creatinine amidohydrolase